ncbi:hypothetical protein RRF57_000528 [Xylaria bambusicola]|uniref:Uncharacterized protein n=1 Tax=Xylaria bambusicola TaxID=326684 RepID=A0AAN7YZR4_9PEZI
MPKANLAKLYTFPSAKKSVILTFFLRRGTSTQLKSQNQSRDHDVTSPNPSHAAHLNKAKTKTKTVAQFNEELKQKMSDIAGDGGAAGIEYKDGKPVAMKRSVKNNMFRYI